MSVGQFLRAQFPPVNRQSVLRHYFPAFGVASYGLFSIHVLNPYVLEDLFPRRAVALANGLLFNAHLGVGLYAYYRGHLKKASTSDRVMYGVYVSVLFNFGSILIWASTKRILPENVLVRSLFGLLTSFCLVAIGREYYKLIDGIAPVEE